ncbi:leucine-rich repeat domain-containing protein [Bacteroides sp.]|uniref:leucine-rich repeat domain-containing protein n=1 Tax=Bacteroides sp. TaxID=29523 RepID=UPI0026166CAE|nr:leucine-rich repeat domain-containing protein [Bacteroides sp.]MDD3039491.1 leucine-rich repeat domain-containing protein [Bacteroides sp.]
MNEIIKKPYNKITSLTLTNAGLTEVPAEVFLCKNLKKLNLSNNCIKSIPIKIAELTKLRVLNLSNNEISQIQTGCCNLVNLETLILNNNKISLIPKQIIKLQNLKILGLSGNKLTKLPDELQKLRKLRQLDISRNELKKLIDGILFENLDSLWGGSNPVIEFDKEYYFSGRFKRLYFFPSYSFASNRDYSELSKNKGNIFSKNINMTSNIHTENNATKSIFICYSHKDIEYKNRIITHLKTLNYEDRDCKISEWSDSKIETGTNWKESIINAISNASGAILIASTDFLASDFIQLEELPRIMAGLNKNTHRIFPIVVKPCRYNNSRLKDFQAVNPTNEPLSGMSETERENMYLKLMDDIDKLL